MDFSNVLGQIVPYKPEETGAERRVAHDTHPRERVQFVFHDDWAERYAAASSALRSSYHETAPRAHAIVRNSRFWRQKLRRERAPERTAVRAASPQEGGLAGGARRRPSPAPRSRRRPRRRSRSPSRRPRFRAAVKLSVEKQPPLHIFVEEEEPSRPPPDPPFVRPDRPPPADPAPASPTGIFAPTPRVALHNLLPSETPIPSPWGPPPLMPHPPVAGSFWPADFVVSDVLPGDFAPGQIILGDSGELENVPWEFVALLWDEVEREHAVARLPEPPSRWEAAMRAIGARRRGLNAPRGCKKQRRRRYDP